MSSDNFVTLSLLSFLHIGLIFCSCPDIGIAAKASVTSSLPPGFSLSGNVTLDFPLLLDIVTPRLSGVHIVSGGRLVFSPHVAQAKLTTDYVKINRGGSLEIGSEDCPFVGNAEILLTGKRGSYSSVDGEKYISVHDGGVLEIHGQPKHSWTVLSRTVMPGPGPHTITLEDDVSSWDDGDQLVLASTDYDLDQAEVVTVTNCQARSCNISGNIRYPHFGEIDSGVDMRGEVGLLTRNVLIHAEMEDKCYGNQFCDEFNFDTFGGHIIAKKGFKSFKVENAEFTKLGQQGIVGRYPLHWHMTGDITAGSSYVRSNSIHHTLQRCVTCHGSFGCQIENNVAFESLGHCYFMEDGVENGTVMTHNLGLNTRKALMIPSDSDPATFWITHPDSYITENTAGGSEGKGFWFLQASLPTGEAGALQASGAEHFFDEGELFFTKIGDISGNTAHSSQFGFFFDAMLLPDQGASDNNERKFSPLEDPKNKTSSKLTTQISDITCYKARRTCVWIHLTRGQYNNLRIADAEEGLFVHELSQITNSVFVGESERNFGVPNKMVNGEAWNRSLPRGEVSFGVRNYQNPVIIEDSVFTSFVDSEARHLRAIGVKRTGKESGFTGANNISFASTPMEGRVGSQPTMERQFLYYDWSGSITGTPDSYIVKNFPHLISDRCLAMPEWGLVSVCPHNYPALAVGEHNEAIIVTRTDIPQVKFTPFIKDRMVFMSSDHTYIVSSKGTFTPMKKGKWSIMPIKVAGVDKGTSMIIGTCVPIGSELGVKDHKSMNSFEDLRNMDGDGYFYDKTNGIVFVNLKGTYSRPVGDVDPCGKDEEACISKVNMECFTPLTFMF